MNETGAGSQPAESAGDAAGQDQSRTERIVVGVDGSEGSLVAVRWALDEAGRRQAPVHLVFAWQMPEAYGPINVWGADVAQNSRHEWAERARAEAERLAGQIEDRPDVSMSWEVIQGHPAHALVGVAQANDLLVVGTRGHGGFVGALLGSVSQHVVSHAVCPVVVVPPLPTAHSARNSDEQRSYRAGVFGQAHEHYQGQRGSGVYEQGHQEPAGQGVFEQGRTETGSGVFEQGRPQPEDV